MYKIIKDKFGVDFLTENEDSVKKEFEVFKSLEHEQRKQYIDFDFTYKTVDKKADFAIWRENLIKELHRRIDFSKINFSGKIIGFYLVIGREGMVDKCEVSQKIFQKQTRGKLRMQSKNSDAGHRQDFTGSM